MHSLVFITCPEKDSRKIADKLIDKRLAACVNILETKSIYIWEGKKVEENEALIIAKTRSELFDEVKQEVKSVHPYKVPEIIMINVDSGNVDYLRWIDDSTSK